MEYSGCWLQYRTLSDRNQSDVVLFCNAEGGVVSNAVDELIKAFQSLYGRKVRKTTNESDYMNAKAGVAFKLDEAIKAELCRDSNEAAKTGEEAYRLECRCGKSTILAASQAGLLYGTYALLRNLQLQQTADYDRWSCFEEVEPKNPLRMLDHWDNLDGSIERGYSGSSFFFRDHEVVVNERTRAYARMVSSVGINAVVINNVNVKEKATELISARYYDSLRFMSELFAAYHIKLYLSVNFAAPRDLGGLNTADPCDERVITWWKEKAGEIWENIPGLGGFLIKADSEGRPGPFTYHRTHAEGANMLADAIKPYGGLVIWRCFVYNCLQDWRDNKTDRARAGYDNFMPLDGKFSENVILQIKNGPMDFQVREPVSPLFGGLKKTNMMLELQITQEYTGQQRHVCYLIPWFKEILGFNTFCEEAESTVGDIISGRTYRNVNCGITAVANTGDDVNWTGHDLAAANLYGYGRLAFDTGLSAEEIAAEWTILTFGQNEKVNRNILKILMLSWPAYEKYTAPLGIGWMVKPGIHYGPDVDGYEYDRWGTYHRADHKGIGVDRTNRGTGYCSQYHEPLASLYSDPKTCPEELLLFFHHMEYDYRLSSGNSILQHIYDTHFEGAMEAGQFLELWKELQGLLDEDTFRRVLERFQHQAEHAKEWRDVINSYFYRKTGIPDQQGRPIF